MSRRFHPLLILALLAAPLFGGCRSGGGAASGKPAAEQRLEEKSAKSTAAIARAHAHFAAGVLHEQTEQPELAIQEFRRAVQEDPEDETLALEVSRRLMIYKQPAQALELLQTAAARKDATGEVYSRLGSILLQLGRREEALAANQTAVKKSPLLLTAYLNLLMNLLQMGRGEEALQLIDTAARQSGAGPDFLVGVADLYQNYTLQFPTQRAAVGPKALEALKRALAMQPTAAQLRLRLADNLYEFGDRKAAAEIYAPLVEQVNDLPLVRETVRAKLVEIYLRDNDHARAREQLESLLRDDPSNPQTYYLLGSIAYEDKRWAEAAGLFKKALLLNPNFGRAYFDLAAAQIAADNAAGALATLADMRGRLPASFLAEYLTGLAEVRLKNYEEAVRRFTQAEVLARAGETNRLTADFYFEAGIALERKGDRAESVRYFEKAIELRADFPEALNYLGYMWAEQGENLERAKELIERALKAEPKSAAYLDSMGWVLFKLNQPKAALDYLLQAVQLIEQPDATLYDHLGDIYAALNETDKAHEAWRKSLKVEDNATVRKKVEPQKTP